ncbi:MAG: hypothetical protein AAB401_02355 [Acidobacteriota bacterium]
MTIESKTALLKSTAAGLLLIGCAGLLGCSAISRFNNRMAKLAAPQQLARSAGGSYATTDVYLRGLEIPNPSEKVLAAVSQLPKDDAILFVAAGHDAETELVYRSIASLSWPREVGALHCGQNPELLFQPRAGKQIRWLMFYRIVPPAGLTPPTEIGPHLKLIPIEEAKEWISYCRQ